MASDKKLYEEKKACLTCKELSLYPDPSTMNVEADEGITARCKMTNKVIGELDDLSCNGTAIPSWCPLKDK